MDDTNGVTSERQSTFQGEGGTKLKARSQPLDRSTAVAMRPG
jgi:hypothetical protein